MVKLINLFIYLFITFRCFATGYIYSGKIKMQITISINVSPIQAVRSYASKFARIINLLICIFRIFNFILVYAFK